MTFKVPDPEQQALLFQLIDGLRERGVAVVDIPGVLRAEFAPSEPELPDAPQGKGDADGGTFDPRAMIRKIHGRHAQRRQEAEAEAEGGAE